LLFHLSKYFALNQRWRGQNIKTNVQRTANGDRGCVESSVLRTSESGVVVKRWINKFGVQIKTGVQMNPYPYMLRTI
jgi:hypothetical protein